MKLWALLQIIAAVLAIGQVPAQTKPEPPLLSICDVLSRPLEYNGKLVRVSGKQQGTNEGVWLVTDKCPGVFVTNDYVWPTEIWLAYAGTNPNPESEPAAINFQFDFGSEKRAISKYRKLRRKAPAECLVFTFAGLFETRSDWSKSRIYYPTNSTWRTLGFGHLNAAPAQLLLTSEDVEIMPQCNAAKSGQTKK
jgi:hypothetical protein